jgi:hypothetical protein
MVLVWVLCPLRPGGRLPSSWIEPSSETSKTLNCALTFSIVIISCTETFRIFCRRLIGPQKYSGRFCWRKHLLLLPRFESWPVYPVSFYHNCDIAVPFIYLSQIILSSEPVFCYNNVETKDWITEIWVLNRVKDFPVLKAVSDHLHLHRSFQNNPDRHCANHKPRR